MIDISKIARHLYQARRQQQSVDRITLEYPDLDIKTAYEIQYEMTKLEKEDGNTRIGWKMGLTSAAKMKQMGVDTPIYGQLFDDMVLENGGVLPFDEHIHPRVEVEIAFILKDDLEGPGITGVHVLAATEYVLPAVEIIDSRYRNFKFTLTDVIADNASSSRYVLGNKLTSPEGLDLDLIGTVLKINGEIKELGAGAAILDHPAQSVAMLANMLAERNEKLKAGEIILAGAITAAVALEPGDAVTAEFDQLGSVSFKVSESKRA